MTATDSLTEAYRRVDALLEIRARDHPRRLEPAWSDLLAAVEDLAARIRRAVGAVRPQEPVAVPGIYEHPVFVVGHRKTGTTLLLDLLDGHPELVVLPGESNHFVTFLPRIDGLAADEVAAEAQAWWILRLVSPSGIPPFWAAGPWNGKPDPYEVFSRNLLALVVAEPRRDTLGLAAVALHAARGWSGRPRAWVEKTPGQEHEVDAILARYPGARFLHVVRDPRGVAGAIARIDGQTGQRTDMVEIGLTVGRSFAAAAANVERLGGDRYLVVRYEELVTEPQATMQRVARVAGIDWDDSLLTPTVGGVPATANSAWSERQVTGTIESRGIDLGRETLSHRSSGIVCAGAGASARAVGYDLPRPRPDAAVEVALRRARLALSARRAAAR